MWRTVDPLLVALLASISAMSATAATAAAGAAGPYLSVPYGSSCEAEQGSSWIRNRQSCEQLASQLDLVFEDRANASLPPGCYESADSRGGSGGSGDGGVSERKMFYNIFWAGRESCTFDQAERNQIPLRL